jgi:putative phosphoribosyl transferase
LLQVVLMMLFKDRRQAGERLAEQLHAYRGQDPLILAVPRGGVEIAAPIFEQTGGEMDLMITRKIGAPSQPELAIGAVTSDGSALLNDDLISRIGVDQDYINQAIAREKAEIERRLKLYRGERPLPKVENRRVILVDDGVATGYTLLMAVRSLQKLNPAELVLAVSVGPPDTLKKLEQEASALFYLEAPEYFSAVGQFYLNFNQVSDDTVIAILHEAWKTKGSGN